MKYKEFREYLKGTDFEVIEDDVLIQINTDGLGYVRVAKNIHRQIILPFAVEEPEQFELIKKALELAETPLEGRREVKKYYLKHKFINELTAQKYINVNIFGEVTIRDNLESRYYKTKFTKAEIEEFKKRFNTDLNDFEFIEVED